MDIAPGTPSLADRFFVEAMSPAFREDPYPHYERFRGPAPLLRVAETIWFALGHADVTTLLRHPRMSTDEQQHAATEAGNALDPNRTRSLLFMDPPDHTRLRNLVARAFTPRRIEGLRAATEAITAELIDAMSGRRHAGRSHPGLRLSAAGPRDLQPAGHSGSRRGSVHRLVARHRPLARSHDPALARDRRCHRSGEN